MEFEIEDRPQLGEPAAFPSDLFRKAGTPRRRPVAPRHAPELRDRAIFIPDQEPGS